MVRALRREAGERATEPRREPPFFITFYRSTIAKKWLMAITGIMLLGFVLAHMIGNLKVYLGEEAPRRYAEWLATSASRRSPAPSCCGRLRIGLIAAFVIHIVAAAQLPG